MNDASQFRRSLLLVAVVFAAFNVAFAHLSHRLTFRKKVVEVTSGSASNVLLVGNSLLDGHISTTSFEQAADTRGFNLVPVNAAMGGAMPPDEYLLYRIAMQRSRPRVIVIGFYDFQLTENEGDAQVSDLIGSRALLFDPLVQPEDVQSIYPFSLTDRLKYRAFRALPALAYRSNAWEHVEALRRRLAGFGMPAASGNNEFGRITDFSALESANVRKFDAEATSFAEHAGELNRANQLMLDQARARGIPVIFLLMPISPYHRTTFYQGAAWKSYLHALDRKVASLGGVLVDASAWYQQENSFADHLHLKLSERDGLSRRIALLVTDQLSAMHRRAEDR